MEPREPCFRAASHVGSSSIGSEMSVWLLLVLLGIVKLPLAALMLWLPPAVRAALLDGLAQLADAAEAGQRRRSHHGGG